MRIGIMGAGYITSMVAPMLKHLNQIDCYAIASRTPGLAEESAKKYGFEKAYSDYESLLNDPLVELVYVATPHIFHYEHVKMCLDHNKPVLCEKPFMLNAKEAREIKEYAKRKQLFCAEAAWPRYQPSRQIITDALNMDLIGEIHSLTTNLSYPRKDVRRMYDPALAGGALMDVGVYGISFITMHFGRDIERLESAVQFTESGVDGQDNLTICYKDGKMATVLCSIYSRTDRYGIFHGEKGYIMVENINNPQSVSIYDVDDNLLWHQDVPEQINGYEYEFIESVNSIQNGLIEAPSMPLDDTIFNMEIMDSFRSSWGLKYPGE